MKNVSKGLKTKNVIFIGLVKLCPKNNNFIEKVKKVIDKIYVKISLISIY